MQEKPKITRGDFACVIAFMYLSRLYQVKKKFGLKNLSFLSGDANS
jgi:hypothetical protein